MARYTGADLHQTSQTKTMMCPVCHTTGRILVITVTNVKSGRRGKAYYHHGRGCETSRLG